MNGEKGTQIPHPRAVQEQGGLTMLVALVSDTKPFTSSITASSAPAELPSICKWGAPPTPAHPRHPAQSTTKTQHMRTHGKQSHTELRVSSVTRSTH